MTSPRELDRRVRQNRNEIDDLHKLLQKTDKKVDKIVEVQQEQGRVQQEHGQILQQHGVDLGSILQTLEDRETSLSLQSERLGSMKHSMKRLEDSQRKVTKRLDGNDERLDSHGHKLDEILGLLRDRQ